MITNMKAQDFGNKLSVIRRKAWWPHEWEQPLLLFLCVLHERAASDVVGDGAALRLNAHGWLGQSQPNRTGQPEQLAKQTMVGSTTR